MEALDTNILVRIATRDDPAQLAKVEKLMVEKFSDEHPAWVSVIVLTELSWVLGRTYGHSRVGGCKKFCVSGLSGEPQTPPKTNHET